MRAPIRRPGKHPQVHMTEKPDPPREEKPDADEAFAATLRNLVNTPHQSRKQPKAPKGGAGKGE